MLKTKLTGKYLTALYTPFGRCLEYPSKQQYAILHVLKTVPSLQHLTPSLVQKAASLGTALLPQAASEPEEKHVWKGHCRKAKLEQKLQLQ